MSMRCPVCEEKNTGRVGCRQYYCWNCLIEFRITDSSETKLYYVEADGSLIEVEKNEVKELQL